MGTPAENRAYGVQALRYWYEAGFKPYTFQMALEAYDAEDSTFLATLGQTALMIAQPSVIEAMQKLSVDMGPVQPRRSYFFSELASRGGHVTADDLFQATADGVRDTVSSVTAVAKFGIGALTPLAFIAVAGILFFYRKEIMFGLRRLGVK